MKKKTGFTYQIEDCKMSVYFRSYNNKIIKCFIYDSIVDKTFIGMATLDPADNWNEEIGCENAFFKAFLKRELVLYRIKIDHMKQINIMCVESQQQLHDKFHRMKSKIECKSFNTKTKLFLM